jgi:phosphatidylinositol alpha-1,6-mannosyltransferase
VLPRLAPGPLGELRAKLRQLPPVAGRLAYSANAIRMALPARPIDVVFCGHILMAPLAAMMGKQLGALLWLQVHGIDAWAAPTRLAKWGAERADLITSVSRYTRQQLLGWWDGDPSRVRVLPNTVDPRFVPGAKPQYLIDRYGLAGRKVLLTVSRLAVSERYKGHDRVIEALPRIRASYPDTFYLIVGEGDDRPYLEDLARRLGLGNHVRFAGAVPPNELADHYRAADVFVMPSKKEGFGIVFLEAAACGLPVVAGNRDGSIDALADGAIGTTVDPDQEADLAAAVSAALDGAVPGDQTDVSRFAMQNFAGYIDDLVRSLH